MESFSMKKSSIKEKLIEFYRKSFDSYLLSNLLSFCQIILIYPSFQKFSVVFIDQIRMDQITLVQKSLELI